MKRLYTETYNTLIELDQYLNREVLRKEVLKERLLSELSFKYTPSKEMIDTTHKFIRSEIDNISKNYDSDVLGSYTKTFGNIRKISPEYIEKQKNFLKSKGYSPELTAPKIPIPFIGKSDIKNLNLIFKTIKYLSKHNDPIIKEYKNVLKSSIDSVLPTNKSFIKKIRNRFISAIYTPIDHFFAKKELNTRSSSPYYSRANNYINMLSKDNKDNLTLGHELTHALTNSEIMADIGGAYSYLGQPENISDKQALDAAKHKYKSLRKINKQLGNDWYYFKQRFKNYLRPKGKKKIDDRTDGDIIHAVYLLRKKADDLAQYYKDNVTKIKDKSFFKKEYNTIIDQINMLKTAKPIRKVGYEKVYSPEVIDVLYKTFGSGYAIDTPFDHPAQIIRSYEILHALRPDIFTRDGIDKRTGRPVPFTLGEKISDTLYRAKSIGKKQYSTVKNKLKKSLSNIQTINSNSSNLAIV